MKRFTSAGAFSLDAAVGSLLKTLQETRLCSMSTVGPNGEAHINTAFFCYSEPFRLYYISSTRSRHSQNLAVRSSMAWTVFDCRQQWGQELRGAQIFGRARPARDAERQISLDLYASRFEQFAKYIADTPAADIVAPPYRFYAFEPLTVTIIDEAIFGEETYVTLRVTE